MSFPDVEFLLCQLIEQHGWVPAGHIGTHAPAKLAGSLPFCRVNRYGGADNSVTDQPSIDIDWFGPDRTIRQTAADAHDWLTLQRLHYGDMLIDVVDVIVGITERPWDDPNVRRFGGSYVINVRR